MDVSRTLKTAWAAVQDASLPEEIHEVAFREAVRLLAPTANDVTGESGTGRPSGNEGAKGSPDSGHSNGDSAPSVTEDEMYDKVAQQTGVDRNKLEQVVHLDNDGPKVSMAGIRLGKNNAERARAVAQILTISRGFGLGESDTSLEIIRAECDRLKVYDSANFSSHMKALVGYIITGTGQSRRVRAKGPGITAFPSVVDNLLEVER